MSGYLRSLQTASLIITVAIAQAATADDFVQLMRDFDEWHARVTYEENFAPPDRLYRERLEFRERLVSIDTSSLVADDQITLEILRHELDHTIGSFEHGRYTLALGLDHGVHLFPAAIARSTQLTSIQECEAYLDRLEALPAAVEQTLELLREGARRGITQPRVVVDEIAAEIGRVLSDHLEALGHPIGRAWESLPEHERMEVWTRFNRRTLPALRRSFSQLRDFIVDEYLPHSRMSIALSDLPNGEAFYAHLLAVETTTSLTAQQLYEMGLKEVQRLRPLILAAIRQTDFIEQHPQYAAAEDDALFQAFREYVLSDERFKFDSVEEGLIAARNVAKRAEHWSPTFFRNLPRVPVGFAVSPLAGGPYGLAQYIPGDLEAGYAASVLLNDAQLTQMPRFLLPGMILHEGVPGHHLQLGLAGELDTPRFRRDVWLPAFGEGWALYAEELGVQMAMYWDPYDDFGRLQWQMLRACRLVSDTAIHAKGWSLEDASDFLRQHNVFSDEFIAREVLRPLSWPAQGTTYTVGLKKIKELHERAKAELGEEFDIRAFHEVVLEAGTVTLPILEHRVIQWIQAATRSN